MSDFWQQLPKPIFCLAPMEGVTDFAFREMFARYSGSKPVIASPESYEGRGNLSFDEIASSDALLAMTKKVVRSLRFNPFVMFTEFVNVDGLTHPEGYKRLSTDLKYSDAQRPVVAQIWGRDPEKFYQAAKIIAELKFDGIDINMGCPQDKEISQRTCAALIREPELAKEIIRAAKKGSGGLPVSVKTRLGYSRVEEMESWLMTLLEENPAAITIHARTKQEKSKVPAHWDKIKEAVKIRDRMFPMSPHPSPSPTGRGKKGGLRPLIIGNGDVKTREELFARIGDTAADGVMVGKGAFGNPWFFAQNHQPDTKERLRVMLEHASIFNQTFTNAKSFAIMRKHFKAYASGFDGAHELRAKLMEAKDLEETRKIVSDFITK